MTDAPTLDQIEAELLSRDDLLADGPAPHGTDQRRRVVRSARTHLIALLARPGELKRLDIWRGVDDLVVHAHVADPAAPAPCALAIGASAWQLLATLLAEPPIVRTDIVAETRQFDDLNDVIASITRPNDDEDERAVVLGAPNAGSKNAGTVLVRVSGAASWWGRAAPGGPVHLRDAGTAAFWAAALAELEPRDGAAG